MADVCLHPLIISRSEQQPRAYYFYTNICVISCDSPLQPSAPFLPFFKISRAAAPSLTRLQGLQHPTTGGSGLPDPARELSPAGAAPISPASTVVALVLGFLLLSAALVLSETGLCTMTLCWQISEVDGCSFWAGVKQSLAKHQLVQKLLGCSNPNPGAGPFQPLHPVCSAAAGCLKISNFLHFLQDPTSCSGFRRPQPHKSRSGLIFSVATQLCGWQNLFFSKRRVHIL